MRFYFVLYREKVVCLWGVVDIGQGVNLDFFEDFEVLSQLLLQYILNIGYDRLYIQIKGGKDI